jgi:subtilisin family serine protease
VNQREEQIAYQLIYAGCEPEPNRYTNDLPINADVWLAYKQAEFASPVELLLTPHLAAGVASLRQAVMGVLPHLAHEGVVVDDGRIEPGDGRRTAADPGFVAANESHVLARITFMQLVALLPRTSWWRMHVEPALTMSSAGMSLPDLRDVLRDRTFGVALTQEIVDHVRNAQTLKQFKQVGVHAAGHALLQRADDRQREAVKRLVNVVALYVALNLLDERTSPEMPMDEARARIDALGTQILDVIARALDEGQPPAAHASAPRNAPPLWLVAVNRPATHAVYASRKTVNADAAIRVFDTGGQGVRWAVIDSGIDARHPAFARLDRLDSTSQVVDYQVSPVLSRVVKTLDFTRFAAITSGRVPRSLIRKFLGRKTREELQQEVARIETALSSGQMLDWSTIEPLLEVPVAGPADGAGYEAPSDGHGTHVAGIIGANWRSDTYAKLLPGPGESGLPPPIELADAVDVCGVCPQIELLDLRVFNAQAGAGGDEGADEFAILAALQYVRYLNQGKDRQYVHGVNLSLSLHHDVRSYGCGSTPVCLECERLVGSGVIVVAAAGNFGYDDDYGVTHLGGAYRGQSITDPGNAPSVITVGSTHRSDPYQYGISYFSSHGPTGDGRVKPDLVAPGEKVWSTIPGPGLAQKDGTSMAAPHVSGVAALLLSRNGELMGHPRRVKEILCDTASDLGRGREFQGHGLVDALRALQSM